MCIRDRREYESTGGYQVDRFETVELGGHTWRSCLSSTRFSDGTSHHSDWYVRQIEGRFVILHFDYYEELKSQADQVYQSIRAAAVSYTHLCDTSFKLIDVFRLKRYN